ncbi:amidohydrolase [Fodinibius sediminis]|uniref:Amidohydrolase n=2 Tax=Fodinibius sediminis TaxID=1214077 RepID=A0A521E9S3_9BACT|nr:amidohydrolase [Fodinibius sediminis]
MQELTALRHRLHQKAEVSGQESETAECIGDFLSDTAPDELRTGLGGHGILASYKGESEGPHLLLRCELDALPIPDKIETDYQSKAEGVGHKCGHDGHMAIMCGVAKLLAADRPASGTVTLLFQPAEETGEGALKILEEEAFQARSLDYCFALHNLPGHGKHQIVVRPGVFAAASVGLEVELRGQTAHAAHPEEGVSPAAAVAQLIEAFSAVPQFYSSLDQATKVTVINAVLGERAFGTSPGHAIVRATLRTYDDELLSDLQRRCLTIAEGLAQTYGLDMAHSWVEPFAATTNDARAVDIICRAAEDCDLEISEKQTPFSWSEDFGHFTQEIPGAMFGLGIGSEHPALHAEQYDFEDAVISSGVLMFMQIIKEIVSKG